MCLKMSTEDRLVQIAPGCVRCPALESDLRKSKRTEARLHALQHKMRNDIERAGGDVRYVLTFASTSDSLSSSHALS